jgi:multidrug efflux system outer membrane protein
VELYDTWRTSTPEQNEYANLSWWGQLGDPFLSELIEQALEYNQDLMAAMWRVEEFAARLGVVRSEQFPQITGNAFASRQKISTTLQPLQTGFVVPIFDAYGLVLNGSYQADLWGQYRNATESACHELLAEVQNRRTVVLTLVNAVASAYIELKQFQLQLLIANETLRSRQESYELSKIRYELGLTSEMQMDQSLSLVQSAQTTTEQLRIAIVLQEDLLSFLIGAPSQEICGGLRLDELKTIDYVPTCSPCELLNQRPDILAAEQQLMAANARIGVARALFLPSVSFLGGVDTETSIWRYLFNGPSSTWDYGTNIVQEIFTGGRLISNLEESYAVKSGLLHLYESTILNAVREVNDSLLSHEINKELVQSQKERVATLAQYVHLSNLRYVEGLTDYLTVLDAERELFEAALEYATFQAQSFLTLIDIYTSLGGGWVTEADSFALCPKDNYHRDR